jgi:hypothetical protein
VDNFLHNSSWDQTWKGMHKLMDATQLAKLPVRGIRRVGRSAQLAAKKAGEVRRKPASSHTDQPVPVSQ